MTAAADSYSQFIDQIRFDGVIVSEHDLVVVFEVVFGGEELIGRARIHSPDVLVGPASEQVLLGINGVVDANIELVGQDGIGNVLDVVVKSYNESVWVSNIG